MRQKRKLHSCVSSVLCMCCKVSSSCWIIPGVSGICSKCSFRFVFFCSFHLQLFHPKLSNMRAVLCCSSEVCFFKRCAPPFSSEYQLYFRVIYGLSHCASELERPRVNQLEVQRFLREGQWRKLNHYTVLLHQSQAATFTCAVAQTITDLKLLLFFFLFGEINQTSDESGFKGKVWLQPESFVHTFGRSAGFSRPPASKYFIANVKS